jgi:hypothetical protein
MNDDSALAVPVTDVMKTVVTVTHVRCGKKR